MEIYENASRLAIGTLDSENPTYNLQIIICGGIKMKKSVYWSWGITGIVLFSIGMSEVAGQVVHHHVHLGPWAYTVGTWGVIMITAAFLYKEIHSPR